MRAADGDQVVDTEEAKGASGPREAVPGPQICMDRLPTDKVRCASRLTSQLNHWHPSLISAAPTSATHELCEHEQQVNGSRHLLYTFGSYTWTGHLEGTIALIALVALILLILLAAFVSSEAANRDQTYALRTYHHTESPPQPHLFTNHCPPRPLALRQLSSVRLIMASRKCHS